MYYLCAEFKTNAMPANKNALIRYKTIDNCLRNRYRRWTLDDLVNACSDALYEMEGIRKGVSVRTVQGDIQIMRSDKLGYCAPIEVYEHKYYRYADDDYSITNMSLSQNDYELLHEAVDMLRQLEDFNQFSELSDVFGRLQDSLAVARSDRRPIIHFDSVPSLRGLQFLSPLYNHILHGQTLVITYQSFTARQPHKYTVCPYMLKEYRNRWFVFGGKMPGLQIYGLALDRIISIEVASDVPYAVNPKFDSEHFFDNLIGVTKNLNSKARRIKFWVSPEQTNYILTKPLHSSQKFLGRNPLDGSSTFEIEVVENFEMYSTFLSYGAGIRIISPRDIVAQMRRRMVNCARMYDIADADK